MKTKALASYDQLILATKRGSYYGRVPEQASPDQTVEGTFELFASE